MSAELELGPFEQAGEVARMLLPAEIGPVQHRAHRRGVKLWVGADACPPEHYEAQLVGRRHVDGVDGVAIEVGFHSERKKEPENDEVLQALVADRPEWDDGIGEEATAGVFLGHEGWRRISEVWIEPDFEDDDLGFEMGSRLADYVLALEPLVIQLRARANAS